MKGKGNNMFDIIIDKAENSAARLYNANMNPVLKGTILTVAAVAVLAIVMNFMPIILLYLMIKSDQMASLIARITERSRQVRKSSMNLLLKGLIFAAGTAVAIMILSEALPLLLLYLLIAGIIDSDDDDSFWFWMFWISRIR